MIDLQSHSHGTIVPVRAQAGARRNSITGEHAGMLKISVTQAPEQGKANQAIVEMLSAALGASKACVELISGAASTKKKFLVRGCGISDLRRKIEATRGPRRTI